MGLFKDIGRNYEEFKRDVKETASETAEFQCTACGELVYAETDTCPECDAEAVEPRED